jgi:ABC-type uncharacterized transport system permease subunit
VWVRAMIERSELLWLIAAVSIFGAFVATLVPMLIRGERPNDFDHRLWVAIFGFGISIGATVILVLVLVWSA